MYWEEPQLEQLFSRMENNLDVPHRIALLNKVLKTKLEKKKKKTDIPLRFVVVGDDGDGDGGGLGDRDWTTHKR